MTNEELVEMATADSSEGDSDLGFLVMMAGKLEFRHINILIGLAIAFRDKGAAGNEADRIEDLVSLHEAQEAICERLEQLQKAS